MLRISLHEVYNHVRNRFTLPLLVHIAEGLPDKSKSDQIKTVFQNNQGKKNIDIYWVADDGGESKARSDLPKKHKTLGLVCQLS